LRDPVAHRSASRSIEGVASYYWEGSRVASGGKYNPYGLTAAHRSLPFGTRLRVSDPKTQRSVIVTINDRGPFVHGRVLDLSLGAARALGLQNRGLGRVHADGVSKTTALASWLVRDEKCPRFAIDSALGRA
jgi:rare lipoprotein A